MYNVIKCNKIIPFTQYRSMLNYMNKITFNFRKFPENLKKKIMKKNS